jgi:hypothetical protein
MRPPPESIREVRDQHAQAHGRGREDRDLITEPGVHGVDQEQDRPAQRPPTHHEDEGVTTGCEEEERQEPGDEGEADQRIVDGVADVSLDGGEGEGEVG